MPALTEEQAKEIVAEYKLLQKQYEEKKDSVSKIKFEKYQNYCVSQFNNLVLSKTYRYKQFANYNDLMQEANLALLMAINTYDVSTNASFFYWAGCYMKTRVARSANTHTAIRYPLRIARDEIPHKENVIPLLVEEIQRPDRQLEKCEINFLMENGINKLNDDQKEIISLAYGLEDDVPMSVTKICKRKDITRAKCLKIMKSAMHTLKKSVKA